MQTMGPDGLGYLPFLATLFFFIFFSNITEVIPGVQFPANARFGIPVVLALLVWVDLQTSSASSSRARCTTSRTRRSRPASRMAILPLVAPIEFLQILIVRPFSLAVRLFANMLAGHLILVTFGVLCAALWAAQHHDRDPCRSRSRCSCRLTGFEVLVSFLQAFIFTILTAVYIGSSMHPDH